MAGRAVHARDSLLKQHRVPFTEHPYRYEERGGTAVSSRELGVDEHVVIKTLVMEDEQKHPLIVLMHGDREVSTKNLARQIGAEVRDPVRAGRGAEAHRVSRRRHVAVRHTQVDAGISRAIDRGSRSHLHQRRRARILVSLTPSISCACSRRHSWTRASLTSLRIPATSRAHLRRNSATSNSLISRLRAEFPRHVVRSSRGPWTTIR